MATARGTFDVHDWAGDTWHEGDGNALGTAALRKRFEGDMQATSAVRIVTASVQGAPTAYVGLEIVDASIGGRRGTFMLQHSTAPSDAGGTTVLTTIVAGSGTDELASISGTLRIELTPDGGHEYVLDYEVT